MTESLWPRLSFNKLNHAHNTTRRRRRKKWMFSSCARINNYNSMPKEELFQQPSQHLQRSRSSSERQMTWLILLHWQFTSCAKECSKRSTKLTLRASPSDAANLKRLSALLPRPLERHAKQSFATQRRSGLDTSLAPHPRTSWRHSHSDSEPAGNRYRTRTCQEVTQR